MPAARATDCGREAGSASVPGMGGAGPGMTTVVASAEPLMRATWSGVRSVGPGLRPAIGAPVIVRKATPRGSDASGTREGVGRPGAEGAGAEGEERSDRELRAAAARLLRQTTRATAARAIAMPTVARLSMSCVLVGRKCGRPPRTAPAPGVLSGPEDTA